MGEGGNRRILTITFDSSVLGVDRGSEPKARYRASQRMRARQRAAQGLKVSTTQGSRSFVLKSFLCVEDGAIRACQDQSAKRGRRGKSAKSEAKVKPGRRSRRSRRKANGFSLVSLTSTFFLRAGMLYCMFGQGKIIRFSIAPGDLQSKGLRTAFQMEKKISSRGLDAQMLEQFGDQPAATSSISFKES